MARRYVMLIDLQLCTGCNTCSVACKQENNLPQGVWWTQVVTVGGDGEDAPAGTYPDLRLDYLPLACQHCANGPCIDVCPSSATSRREDGIVMQDPSLCIGCRYCMMVCPFTSVRVFADEHPKYVLPFPTGENPIPHRGSTVEKCTFCAHRVVRGEQPACVESCPTTARTFGDLNDPTSQVAQLLAVRPHFSLLADKGTGSSVYYLT